MTDSPAQLRGLPVAGYQPQSEEAVAMVNVNKHLEALVLKRLDDLKQVPGIDGRWLAIARTQIEDGFMAANRAVFQPKPVTLDYAVLKDYLPS